MERARPAKPTHESERRFATVVFADISGFTSMSEKMDPEDVTAVMNHCFEILEDAVTSHGGHVDKYIGDCVMALFGVPKALERAPERAVQATIEMRDRIEAFNREQKLAVPLLIHAGINSGLVLAGEVGGSATREFTVMGDTVNLASRLKDLAPKGAIWVGPQTYRYTEDAFRYEALPPLTVKGKEKAIPAYSVVAVKSAADVARATSERMVFSGVVGRAHELGVLRDAVGALARGDGGIVNLIGEAGLGKTRLIGELASWPETDAITCLRGAGVAIGRTLPFHPFVELFRDWARIDETDADEDALAKLTAAVAAIAENDAGEIVPFIATMMGVRISDDDQARIEAIEGDAREKLLVKHVRTLVERIAAAAPTLVIIEDLHWADESSLRLLEALLRLAAEHRVLFLHALRPAYSEPVQRVLQLAKEHYGPRCIDIALEPLSAKDCDHLVRNLLQLAELPYGALGALLRKADGNPFFIEEVVRSLIDDGAVEYRNNRFTVTEKIATVVVPGTIQELIMNRVDRLTDRQRRTLQVGAVIGRNFPLPVLAAVLDENGDLEFSLASLKKRQLIVERRSGGESEYMFKHALAQETIYESILQKTRKELHARVARTIEELFAERLSDFYGMLAYHYGRAENLERAEEYLFKAGDEAIRAAASSEALGFFEEASRLYFLLHGDGGDARKKALLEKNIGLALLNKGKLAECVPHFNDALRYLGEPVPHTPLKIALQFGLDATSVLRTLYVGRHGRKRVAEDGADREVLQIRFNRAKAQTTTDTTRFFFDTIGSIRRLNKTDPSTVDEACGMYAGGAALFSFSGLSPAIGARFLAIAGSLVREGNVRDAVTYESMRFIHGFLCGDWRAELSLDDELIAQALRHGQLWDVSTYLGLASERDIRQGKVAAARAKIAKLAEIADLYGSDFAKSNEDGYRALLALETRDLDTAETELHAYHVSRVEKLFNLLAHGWFAKLWLLRGDTARAAGALDEAEKIIAALGRQVPAYHRSPYALSRFMYDVAMVEAASAAGSSEATRLAKQARRSWRAALRSARRIAGERTETFKLCGRLCWLVGKEAQAVKWWARSLTEGEQLGADPEVARTHLEIAQRLLAKASTVKVNGLDADAHREYARASFAQLGLTSDLAPLGDAARPTDGKLATLEACA